MVGNDRNIYLVTKFKLLEHLCCPHTGVRVVCVLDSAPSGPTSLIERLQDTDRKVAAANGLDKPQAKRMVAVRAQKPSFKVGQLSGWVPRGFRMWFSKVQSRKLPPKYTGQHTVVEISRKKTYVIKQHGSYSREAENRLKPSTLADMQVEPIRELGQKRIRGKCYLPVHQAEACNSLFGNSVKTRRQLNQSVH